MNIAAFDHLSTFTLETVGKLRNADKNGFYIRNQGQKFISISLVIALLIFRRCTGVLGR